jgi:hypothetical protein
MNNETKKKRRWFGRFALVAGACIGIAIGITKRNMEADIAFSIALGVSIALAWDVLKNK